MRDQSDLGTRYEYNGQKKKKKEPVGPLRFSRKTAGLGLTREIPLTRGQLDNKYPTCNDSRGSCIFKHVLVGPYASLVAAKKFDSPI